MNSLENFRVIVFRTVAEQSSFRKAAEKLYLTQPAVSLQIKALEEELGVLLFSRAAAQISMTKAGEILFAYSEAVRGLRVQAQADIAGLSGEHTGHLALGASTTIAQYLLPQLLAEFNHELPHVRLTLMSGNTEHIVNALEEQKIGLGLIEGPPRNRDVKTEAFLEDELVLIASTAHEFSERNSVSASDLARWPLLLRERGSGSRHVLELALEQAGIKRNSLKVVMELDSTEAIKSAVEAGLGVGFVSRWAIAKDLRLNFAFKVVDVGGLQVRRQFLIASPPGPEPMGLAKEFRRYLIGRAGAQRLEPQANMLK